MNTQEFFQGLWKDYISITPQAEKIHSVLEARGEEVINDHVAFRTFNQSPVTIAELEPLLFALGYKTLEPYKFEQKKLDAIAYTHEDPKQPSIFISELRVEAFSEKFQDIVKKLCAQIDPAVTKSASIFSSGCLWAMPSWEEYQTLLAESDYAAWLSVMGYRANHFTVSVNHLKDITTLEQLLDLIEATGMPLNTQGGRVKGGKEVYLAQGSTIADSTEVTFAGGDTHSVPSCFYEFAQRFETSEGVLYPGFVANNADKIFESTNVNK